MKIFVINIKLCILISKASKDFFQKISSNYGGLSNTTMRGYYDAGLWKINPKYIIKSDYVLFTGNLTLANFDE